MLAFLSRPLVRRRNQRLIKGVVTLTVMSTASVLALNGKHAAAQSPQERFFNMRSTEQLNNLARCLPASRHQVNYITELHKMFYCDGSQWTETPYSIGQPGPRGPRGFPGPKGDTGPAGSKGDQGAPGPKGDTGPAGPKGDQGAAGPKGDTGLTGPVGPKGEQGETGPQGIAGPSGPAGAAGLPGATGTPGAAGPQGPVGPTGSQGPVGPAGPAGTYSAGGGVLLSNDQISVDFNAITQHVNSFPVNYALQADQANLATNAYQLGGNPYSSYMLIGSAGRLQRLQTVEDIQIGDSARNCSPISEGIIRFNRTTRTFEGCDGTAWVCLSC